MRFLAQIDDQKTAHLGLFVRNPVGDLRKLRRVELMTPRGAKRWVESTSRSRVAPGTLRVVVEYQVGACAIRLLRRARLRHPVQPPSAEAPGLVVSAFFRGFPEGLRARALHPKLF